MKYTVLKSAALAIAVMIPAVAYGQAAKPFVCTKRFVQADWTVLLKGVSAENKKRLAEDKAFEESQRENLKHTFSLSCEAVRRGLHKDETNAAELEFIRTEAVAVAYDKSMAKSAIPFSRITEVQVAEFYKEPQNIVDFDRFLDAKIELLTRSGAGQGTTPTAEEREQAKDFFARIKISEKQSVTGLRGPSRTEAELRARLQQAQFLSRLVAEAIAPEFSATDAEVADYLATHPELDPKSKRERAEKILQRAKAGEDFAKLADEFTEDPGNEPEPGKKNGGLYADVPVGRMVPPFEKAALAVEPGQVYPQLVETDYGFHIVKLEKKTGDPDVIYDVRHILILTGYKDPEEPEARPVPVTTWVKTQIENKKEGAIIARIVKENGVVVTPYVPPRATPAKRIVRKRR